MNVRLIAFLFAAFALASMAAAEDTAAKSTFGTKCSICHGQDGHGNTPIGKTLKIKDFHSPEVQGMSDADLKGIVTNGKNKMPAFKGKLTDTQIDQVLAYVRQLGK